MNYDELLENIKINFQEKIKTKDKLLEIKIFNNLFNWYKDNFEKDLKKALKESNQLKIISILKEIDKVCRLDDYEKMKIIYKDENFEKLKKISKDIFEKVKNFIEKNEKTYTIKKLQTIEKNVNKLADDVNELLKEKSDYERSETLLDIDYLKNNGKVDYYSIRTYELLKYNQI